ncbi:MAG: glycosyltransferase family 2 protein [Flavobacteriaceae bacterium]|nr:glycosyltransferase family 2 protein [Flavobacteriaceae bacterium]
MQSDHPLVTIILPVYNGEKTLGQTLESLLAQTFTNFEILIGIDGTTDDSKAIAESYSDKRIKIFENPVNLGLGPNVNKLIGEADSQSNYLAMAEQDDIYVKERLGWQVDYLNTNKNVGLITGIAEFISDFNRVQFPGILVKGNQFPQGEDLFKYLYINQLKVVNTCMMWRKDVHINNQLEFTDRYPNMNVDWDYILRFSLVSEIHGLHKVLVYMNRKLDNRSVTTDKSVQFETSRKLLNDFKHEFPQLVSRSTYSKALKVHRKIELGHKSKLGIILFSLYYFVRYFDPYFIKYIVLRISKYRNKSNT